VAISRLQNAGKKLTLRTDNKTFENVAKYLGTTMKTAFANKLIAVKIRGMLAIFLLRICLLLVSCLITSRLKYTEP
jgi:hypothetical protein